MDIYFLIKIIEFEKDLNNLNEYYRMTTCLDFESCLDLNSVIFEQILVITRYFEMKGLIKRDKNEND